jgi:hypothetical protein
MDVVALLVIVFGAVTVLYAASWVFVSPLGRRGLERRIRATASMSENQSPSEVEKDRR